MVRNFINSSETVAAIMEQSLLVEHSMLEKIIPKSCSIQIHISKVEDKSSSNNIKLAEACLANSEINVELETDEMLNLAPDYKSRERRIETFGARITECTDSDSQNNRLTSELFGLDDFADSLEIRSHKDEKEICIQLKDDANSKADTPDDFQKKNNKLKVDLQTAESLILDEMAQELEPDVVSCNYEPKGRIYAYQREDLMTELKNMNSMIGNDTLVNKFLALHISKVIENITSLNDTTKVQIRQPVRSNIKRLQNLKMFITSHGKKVESLTAQIREQDLISKIEIRKLMVTNDVLLKKSEILNSEVDEVNSKLISSQQKHLADLELAAIAESQYGNLTEPYRNLPGYELDTNSLNAKIDRLAAEIKVQSEIKIMKKSQSWNFNDLHARLEAYGLDIKLRDIEIDKLRAEISEQGDVNKRERELLLFRNDSLLNQIQAQNVELDGVAQKRIAQKLTEINLKECVLQLQLDLKACSAEIDTLNAEIIARELMKEREEKDINFENTSLTNKSLGLRIELENLTEELCSSERKACTLETEILLLNTDITRLNTAALASSEAHEIGITSLQAYYTGLESDIVGRDIEIKILKAESTKISSIADKEPGMLMLENDLLSDDIYIIECTTPSESKLDDLKSTELAVISKEKSLRSLSRLPLMKKKKALRVTSEAPFRRSSTSDVKQLPMGLFNQHSSLPSNINHLSLIPLKNNHSNENQGSQGGQLLDTQSFRTAKYFRGANETIEYAISSAAIPNSDQNFPYIATDKTLNRVHVTSTLYSSLMYYGTCYSKVVFSTTIAALILVDVIIIIYCCI